MEKQNLSPINLPFCLSLQFSGSLSFSHLAKLQVVGDIWHENDSPMEPRVV